MNEEDFKNYDFTCPICTRKLYKQGFYYCCEHKGHSFILNQYRIEIRYANIYISFIDSVSLSFFIDDANGMQFDRKNCDFDSLRSTIIDNIINFKYIKFMIFCKRLKDLVMFI